MKFLICDCETSGSNAQINGLIESSYYIVIDGKIKEKSQYLVSLFDDDKVNEKAMEAHPYTLDQIKGFEDPIAAMRRMDYQLGNYVNRFDKQDKFIFVGYNATFDYQFMRAFFNKAGNPYFGSLCWYPPLDLMQWAFLRLVKKRPKMKNFKLSTVVEQFGIPVEEDRLHEALYDVELTFELFKALMKKKKS